MAPGRHAWPIPISDAAAACFAAFAALTPAGPASAATTVTVVDLPTRGVTVRFLYVHPVAPVANVVFLPGNDGFLGIRDDGSMPTLTGRCGPFARDRDAFAARGFALALVDRSSDGRIREYEDVLSVVRYLRMRDPVPTWIAGGSASTLAVLDFAARYPQDDPLGVIVFSPWGRDDSRAAAVKRPTLVLFHERDAYSEPRVAPLVDALTAAPVKERIGLDGGDGGSECGGHHLYMGIDAKFVDAVSGFVNRNDAMLRKSPGR